MRHTELAQARGFVSTSLACQERPPPCASWTHCLHSPNPFRHPRASSQVFLCLCRCPNSSSVPSLSAHHFLSLSFQNSTQSSGPAPCLAPSLPSTPQCYQALASAWQFILHSISCYFSLSHFPSVCLSLPPLFYVGFLEPAISPITSETGFCSSKFMNNCTFH